MAAKAAAAICVQHRAVAAVMAAAASVGIACCSSLQSSYQLQRLCEDQLDDTCISV